MLLPAIDREPLFHLEEQATTEGYPLVAVYGEQGPQVAGWFDRYEPRWAEGLHLLERSYGRPGRSPPCSKPPDRPPRTVYAIPAPTVPDGERELRASWK